MEELQENDRLLLALFYMEDLLSPDSMLTIKIYDSATDVLLYEETQALNNKHHFEG